LSGATLRCSSATVDYWLLLFPLQTPERERERERERVLKYIQASYFRLYLNLKALRRRVTALLVYLKTGNRLRLTLTLLTMDWASGTGGCREYSARRGSNDETNVDLSCCASWQEKEKVKNLKILLWNTQQNKVLPVDVDISWKMLNENSKNILEIST